MPSFIREIVHEIILNQVRFVNFISNELTRNKMAQKPSHFLFGSVCQCFYTALAPENINEQLHAKTRPNHTAVKIRTSETTNQH